MKGFTKYFFLVWATGLGVMAVFAISTGHQDWKAERESALNRVGQLSTSLRLSLENLTEKTANELTRIIEVEIVSSGMTHWLSESSFRSIAMVGRDSRGQWAVDWAKSKTPGSMQSQYQKWLPKLPMERIKGETLSWSRVELDNRRPMLLLGVQLKVKAKQGESYKVAFGLLPLNYLSSLTEPLKTKGEEVFLVDSAGYALTFPDPAYVGSIMDVHPLVSDLKKSQKLSEFGSFRNLSNDPTVGGYEKSQNSNVYVVANQTIKSRQMAMLGVAESGIMGFGLILFLSIIALFFEKKDSTRFRQMTSMLRKGNSDSSKEKAGTSSPGDIEKERRELFEQLGLTFLTHLRGPIYSSLGKIHKLTGNIKDSENKKDISFIETEVRRLRDFIEGLGQSFDLDSRPSERIDLSMLVESMMANYRKALSKREIAVEFEPHANSLVRVSRDDLVFILNTILNYAANNLSYSGDERRIQIKIDRVGGMSRLSMLMVGAKFPVKEIESLFQVRDRNQLELSFSRGFALSWNGNLSAESSILGARIHLEFPAVDVEEKVEVRESVTATPEEPLATKVTSFDSDNFNSRKVDDELSKVLPPTPSVSPRTEVSVVDDLTATVSSLNFEKMSEPEPEPPNADNALEVKIRKPKVRFDV